MLSSKEDLQLASIKAVDRNYPLVGHMELQSESVKEIVKNPPKKGQVWLDRRLMDILDLTIGDKVSIGEKDFSVSHVIISEPDRGSNSFAFAPKAIINMDDLDSTNVIQPGIGVNLGSDGSFDPEDQIVFYGRGPSGFDNVDGNLNWHQNIYFTSNSCWLLSHRIQVSAEKE